MKMNRTRKTARQHPALLRMSRIGVCAVAGYLAMYVLAFAVIHAHQVAVAVTQSQSWPWETMVLLSVASAGVATALTGTAVGCFIIRIVRGAAQ